jgi:hypothetical protein
MGLFRGKREEKKDSVVLDKLEKSRQVSAKMFDFIFCAGVAGAIGYMYAKLNM